MAMAPLVGVGILAIKAVGVMQYEAAILRFPFQWDDAEGVIRTESTLIVQKINPYAYQPFISSHFYAGPYMPLYTLLSAVGISVVGTTFKLGRAGQLVATLRVGVWIAGTVHRVAKSPVTLLLGVWEGAIFLIAHLVAFWIVLVRPDMTALLWKLTGVTILSRGRKIPAVIRSLRPAWPDRRMIGTLALGSGCFAMGWWTKQTFVAIPIAYILYLFLRQPRAGVVLGGLYGTMVLVSLGLFTLVTSGGFAQKILAYQGSWQWYAYRRLAQPFIEQYGLLLALALLTTSYVCLHAKRITFSALWFLLTMATEVRHGRWDDTAIIDDIAAGRYRLIALRYDVSQVSATNTPKDSRPGFVRAIQLRYRLVANNVLKLYVPIAQANEGRIANPRTERRV